MSGPIVRSGPSPEFTKNWDSIFTKKSAGRTAAAGTKSAKAAKKSSPGTASAKTKTSAKATKKLAKKK